MGFHTIFDGLDDIVSPGNLEVISLTERYDIKRCPFCDKSPIGVLYDSDEGKRVHRILCTQHQDECDPKLRTAPYNWLDGAVLDWNRRVKIVMSEQGKVKSNHSRDVQSFEDVSHKDFLNFLEEEGNNG